MDDIKSAVLYDSDIKFNVKGRDFTVKPLPLKHIINGDFQNSGIFFPTEKDKLGQRQLYNFVDKKTRNELDKWMQRLLFLDGVPVTLEQACEMEWDIVDIGRFLDISVQASG